MEDFDKRTKQKGGYFLVRTLQPLYTAGDTVEAVAFIRSKDSRGPCKLTIEVKGKEKAKFKYWETIEKEDGEQERVEKKAKDDKTHFKKKDTVLKLEGIPEGDTEIRFAF